MIRPMRFTYPRSFVSLLLLGFTIVAAPLMVALFSNTLATALERSARQYAIAGEPSFLEAYQASRGTFVTTLAQLEAMPLSAAQRDTLKTIENESDAIHEAIARTGPTPQLSQRLARDFAALSGPVHALVDLGDHVIDASIEQLRAQAVQSRNSVFWLMIALVPTAILLIASFTFLISRPITQVSAGIRSL